MGELRRSEPASVPGALSSLCRSARRIRFPRLAGLSVLLVAVALCCCPALRGSGAALAAEEVRAAPGPAEEFDPRELEGSDPKVAELAAHRLLQAIATKDPAADPEKVAKLSEYFLEKLRPDADPVTTARLVDALATRITSGGPPLENMGEVLLPLVGEGPPAAREAVVRAMQALIRYELGATRKSPTLVALTSSLVRDPPPRVTMVRDAARISWDVDGKAILGALVAGMVQHGSALPGTDAYFMAATCLEELRARVPRDFGSVDGWQKWWSESREQPLEAILTACFLRNGEEYVTDWKQTIRRLRETGDAERLLLAIQDTLSSVHVPELRTAAAVALGDFADWIVEMRLAAVTPPGATPEGDPKDKLLRRVVGSLQALLVRKDVYSERQDTRRAALVALRKHNVFIEKNPELLGEVSRLVSLLVSESGAWNRANHREELLETIRLAGALHVESTRGFVEALLAGAPTPGAATAAPDDLELRTAAVTALGRILEKKGISQESAALLMGCFRKPPEGPEKAVREYRRACVTSLGADAPGTDVRDQLCAFHTDLLLSKSDRDLWIPAILGLGTLAHHKHEGAFLALLDLLARQDQLEPQEVIAAIDSIAYVGGPAALNAFLEQSVTAKDKSIRDHIQQKIVGLVQVEKLGALVGVLEKLQSLALAEDSGEYLRFAQSVWSQEPIQELVASARQGAGSADRVESLWKVTFAMACARDFLGLEKELNESLEDLGALIQKEPQIKENHPEWIKDLADFRAVLEQRKLIAADLAKEGSGDVAPVIKDLESLVSASTTPYARWRNLRWIHQQLARDNRPERLERIREAWVQALTSERGRGLWEGLPPQFREKHLGRLDALKPVLGPPPTPGMPR